MRDEWKTNNNIVTPSVIVVLSGKPLEMNTMGYSPVFLNVQIQDFANSCATLMLILSCIQLKVKDAIAT
jgi:hypothetical protein